MLLLRIKNPKRKTRAQPISVPDTRDCPYLFAGKRRMARAMQQHAQEDGFVTAGAWYMTMAQEAKAVM